MKTVIIVGGGTSGWSTAALLSADNSLKVVVVDPSSIPTIGVGESTLPHISHFHSETKLPELLGHDWIDKVDGTHKLTIEFADFNKIGGYWVHPFLLYTQFERQNTFALYNDMNPDIWNCSQREFVEKYTVAGKFRKQGFIHHRKFRKNAGAFHLNAGLYVELLRSSTLKRSNVRRIDSEVSDVILDDKSYVEQIVLETGERLSGDLYVDCTGFHSLLAERVGSLWTCEKDRLRVDRVILAQLPYKDSAVQMRNTTYCHALKNGWVFNIPLQSRIGTGYIHSSDYCSEDEAKYEFRQHLSKMYGYTENEIQTRTLNFRTGYRKETWKNNVVCLGLNAFFCEPIESTAIAMSQYAAIHLRNFIVSKNIYHDKFSKIYNDHMVDQYIDTLEFVELHYSLSSRSDSDFWKHYSSKKKTPRAQELMDFFSKAVSGQTKMTLEKYHNILGTKGTMFSETSYCMMFHGYGLHDEAG